MKKSKDKSNMLGNMIMWMIFDYPSLSADIRWSVKMILVKLKLYKPDKYELECIEHNKKIK